MNRQTRAATLIFFFFVNSQNPSKRKQWNVFNGSNGYSNFRVSHSRSKHSPNKKKIIFIPSLIIAAELAKKRKNPAESIEKKLAERPTAKELQDKNILKSSDPLPNAKSTLEKKLKLVAKK